MVEGKVKFALWFAPETRELVSANYRQDNCKSMSDFIEKAVLFYCGYLQASHAEYYLPRVLGSVLQGTLGLFGDRIGRLLSTAQAELKENQGPVWTLIFSLRREDAARLGYGGTLCGISWRDKDSPREHLPLSRQKEFCAIKNLVIREALSLNFDQQGIRIDSRRRKKRMEKRLALGHKPNDHEQQVQS